jgi:PIN domain nuclease of toxin-antitoxin system
LILLDTHVIVWLASAPEKLSRRAVEAIANARRDQGGLAISGVTLYEIARAVAYRKIEVRTGLDRFLERIEKLVDVRPITPRIATFAAEMPNVYPKDPMDRLIGATSIVEGLDLVTADWLIRKSSLVRTVW